jgi:hypothetical protein
VARSTVAQRGTLPAHHMSQNGSADSTEARNLVAKSG